MSPASDENNAKVAAVTAATEAAAAAPVAGEEAPRGSQARATGIVSVAILCSRVLGLVREVVFAGLFGANRWTDAFNIAFRTPNMLRDLFAEGALSTAFVTTFTKTIRTEGRERAFELAHRMATLATVFMSLVVVLGILLAPWIIRILMPDWSTYQIDFTVMLARIMYPFIAVVSVSALVMGMLNAQGKFFIPALASSFFNIGSIVGGLALGWWMDPDFGPASLVGFACGTMIGGLCQLFVQIPTLLGTGFRFRADFTWRDPGVAKVLGLMWPAVISGSAVQVNVFLNSVFASFLAHGSVTWLEKAFRLMQLPLGVFGVAVATVTLPAVSRAAADGLSPEFGRLLSKGMRLVAFLTIPSAVGLIVLAEPVIALIYERFRFTAHDTAMAAAALRTYAVGLVFYSGIKVVQPAFYALDRRFIPMAVSFGSIAVSAGLNALFVFGLGLGHEYLALSTSLAAAVNFGFLYFLMRRLAPNLGGRGSASALLRIAVAAVVLGLVSWAGLRIFWPHWREFGFVVRMLFLLPTIALAGGIYFAVCYALRVEECRDFTEIVRRRLSRR